MTSHENDGLIRMAYLGASLQSDPTSLCLSLSLSTPLITLSSFIYYLFIFVFCPPKKKKRILTLLNLWFIYWLKQQWPSFNHKSLCNSQMQITMIFTLHIYIRLFNFFFFFSFSLSVFVFPPFFIHQRVSFVCICSNGN